MLDAHIHLQDIPDDKRKELISYFCDQKFSALFCNGTSPEDWSKVLSLVGFISIVTPFIGIHPWFVNDLPQNWEKDFEHLLHHHKCGIGEIGLDKTPKGGDFEKQKIVFVRQFDTAIMRGRVCMVHCVKAWEAMMSILRTCDFHRTPFIMHSFIGSHEISAELISMGAMISLSQRSLGQKDAQKIIASIPDDRILLETDFPYLPGEDKGQVGVADYVQAIEQIYVQTAKMRNISVEQLSEQVRKNAGEVLEYV